MSNDFSTTTPIPGTPATVPGAPATVPGTPSQPGTSQPAAVNVFASNDVRVTAGFVQVDYAGFFQVEQRGAQIATNIVNLRHKLCQTLASQMQAWARDNAPWQDRTGDARKGLVGTYIAESGSNQSSAEISHTVEYGVFLETMQGGRFQIILPTLLHFVASLGKIETEEGFEFAGSGERIT